MVAFVAKILPLLFILVSCLCAENETTAEMDIHPDDAGILPHNFFPRFFEHIKTIMDHILQLDKDIPIEKDVTFFLSTTGSKVKKWQLFVNDTTSLSKTNFLKMESTIFIIHGWTDNIDHEIFTYLRQELHKRLNVNIIMVDWRRISMHYYPLAANSIDRVANHLQDFIQMLLDENYIQFSHIHLIGHSLGAQISGLVGNHFNGEISRITGLDPAGPMFEFWELKPPELCLDTSDAQFIDVIHTASEVFGVAKAVGHVDYYPNYGVIPQPGCYSLLSLVSCSHVRSVQYLTESINTKKGFWTAPCGEYKNVPFDKTYDNCKLNKSILMGFWTPLESRGSFLVNTNEQSPFAKGPGY